MLKNQIFHVLIFVLMSLLILTSCSGMADYNVDLPGEYSVVRTSAHQVTIAPKIDDSHWGMTPFQQN
ncbi:hypothetical protein [Alkalihalobacillus sp. LMS39]|uniref:hypothetical protein n=1 Tax=Alkalihalobacillus sp. LMS39 TaxID=2924032 RepID=UPI001FB2B025|nr:hypothetical protein [Alkalihalobacillus sp. LMS39]UOE95153.1 hypothetical protein MM271_05875 [Alkalihalobacillus sp. LMS39]